MNLVTTVASFITPMIANRIASALGVNSTLVTTAIGAIVPALLAGIAGKVATPSGAGALFDVIDKQDINLLGSFADKIGGADQSSIIDGGTAALTGLLGGSQLGALSSAIGKFAGASPAQSTGLIGMLAPVVLGQLGGAAKSGGLDAAGLASLLMGQKQNIAAALPAGFADLIGGSGLLDGIADALPKPAAPAATASPKPATAPSPSYRPEAPAGFNWAPWAAGVALLAGLFYVFGGGIPKAPSPPAQSTAPSPATVSAVQASESARRIFADLTATLGTVKDQSTAQAALPKLNEVSGAIDALTKVAAGMSGDIKTTLAKLIASQLPALTPVVANVLKVPGAEALLKPALDQIVAKLTALSKV